MNILGIKEDKDKKNEEFANETEPALVDTEPQKRNIVKVCKVGSDHIFGNKNNHDFMFNLLNMKIVLDGCGSGNHSEIGTRLFAQLFARKVKEFYDEIVAIYNMIDYFKLRKKYLIFLIKFFWKILSLKVIAHKNIHIKERRNNKWT